MIHLLVNGALAILLVFAPTQAPVQMKTAHRMAERFATRTVANHHDTRCWRHARAVKCRTTFHGITEPVIFDEGRVVDTVWIDTVTIRRHGHRLVLTSFTFAGRLTQRG
jgi:hypothetical protein